MLFMASKYSVARSEESERQTSGFRRAVVANANRGGENVATGALMGALLGASCGYSNLPKDLVEGLQRSQRPQLDTEIDAYINASMASYAKR